MKGSAHVILYLTILVGLLLVQGLVIPLAGEDGAVPTEGQHPLLIVKAVVEVTSDWTTVEWNSGPLVLATRHAVVQGAGAPGLQYTVSGLTVWVSKQSFDTTKVVVEVEALALEGDPSASVRIEKGDIESTRVTSYGYSQAQPGFVEFGEFLHQGTGPRDFQLGLAALYGMPAATATVAKAVPDLEKDVLAFYYPWYGSLFGPSGQWVHWEGVPPTPAAGGSIGNSAHYPLLGAYDTADERVLGAHMAMARQAGIDALIASWWGPGTFEDAQVNRILQAAEQAGLQVSLYYESVRTLTQQDIIDELVYVVGSYASHPAFLKSEGKPVLFLYAVPHADRDPAFWLQVRRDVEVRVGPVVLVGDVLGDGFPARYLHVFDGFHAYIYLGGDPASFYGAPLRRMRVGLSSAEEVEGAFLSAFGGGAVRVGIKPVSLTVIPGNDLSAIRGDPDLFRDREDGARYTRLWELAIDLDADSVLITSWNEWHEGTEIEPSREYGFEYLTLTRQLAERFKQTPVLAPLPRFSAVVADFELGPDLQGVGDLKLAAEGTPMLLVEVRVLGREGVLDVDLGGDFYAYLKEEGPASASVVVPSVPVSRGLTVRAAFTASSMAPVLNVVVDARDPLGFSYNLFKGSLRISDQVGQLTEEVQALLAEINRLRDELTDLEGQVTDLESQITELNGRLAEGESGRRSLAAQVPILQLATVMVAAWALGATLLLLRRRRA